MKSPFVAPKYGVAALAYAYDSASNRTRITHPDGVYFVSEHDALGRQLCTYELDPTSTSGMVYSVHADHGGLLALGLRNGAVTSFAYDGATRLNAILHYLAAPTGNVMWIFGRNPAGQIASQWLSNDAFAWTGHYPVQRAYATNGLNQYSAAGAASFAYDPNASRALV